ncbi:cytidylyltransferase domain-containing protein [Aestuariivirga litoralis]|uniref:cytidylyltransferase domain-containing protein n=1 Tax=Aestuariivirga litoralis TaxID=2650924 RepID=UPI0018C60645|nr:hypothetical protein [Aestuariivirga litoralis]MBG1232740.1 hypothetical protein [Aestuariivirga litoralis]
MIEFENTVLVISASMAGAGMPGKPMLDVGGKPLVLRAIEQAEQAKLGRVLVATAENKVAESVRVGGGDALVASGLKPAPSDLAAAIIAMRDPQRTITHLLVYPSELAAIPVLDLSLCLAGLTNDDVDFATLAAPAQAWRPGQNKVVAPLSTEREVAYLRNLEPLAEGEDAYQHIPVLAWRRAALEKFAALPVMPQEKALGSEIPRALSAGLRCAAVKVDRPPLTVDTASDLDAIRRLWKA